MVAPTPVSQPAQCQDPRVAVLRPEAHVTTRSRYIVRRMPGSMH